MKEDRASTRVGRRWNSMLVLSAYLSLSSAIFAASNTNLFATMLFFIIPPLRDKPDSSFGGKSSADSKGGGANEETSSFWPRERADQVLRNMKNDKASPTLWLRQRPIVMPPQSKKVTLAPTGSSLTLSSAG
ncbi:hypothetical protein TorRG33x02_127290 [Trema orientale]|uniref:Uncharacterized protein n=1 Tax=Trema orientale TaxID=63057 RepID=A0A2P5F0X5_TREOI|nr:hypothetical protein TorRG33x02_127290 [Trema orientale]